MYQHDLKTRASDASFHDMMLFLLAGLLETDDRLLLEDKLRNLHRLSLQFEGRCSKEIEDSECNQGGLMVCVVSQTLERVVRPSPLNKRLLLTFSSCRANKRESSRYNPFTRLANTALQAWESLAGELQKLGFPPSPSGGSRLIFQRNDPAHVPTVHNGLDLHLLSDDTLQSANIIAIRLGAAMKTRLGKGNDANTHDQWQHYADTFARRNPARAPSFEDMLVCLEFKRNKDKLPQAPEIFQDKEISSCCMADPLSYTHDHITFQRAYDASESSLSSRASTIAASGTLSNVQGSKTKLGVLGVKEHRKMTSRNPDTAGSDGKQATSRVKERRNATPSILDKQKGKNSTSKSSVEIMGPAVKHGCDRRRKRENSDSRSKEGPSTRNKRLRESVADTYPTHAEDENAENKKIPASVQSAIYAAERLSSSVVIAQCLNAMIIGSHFSLLSRMLYSDHEHLLDECLWLWWYDRGGAVQTYGLDFVPDLPYLLDLFAILAHFNDKAWGDSKTSFHSPRISKHSGSR
jgi:hypothetical protein